MPFRVQSFLRSRGFAFVIGLVLSCLATVPFANAQDLVVKYDQSQILRLPRPVAEIIIGNSSIIDVTVQSSNLLVITGKTFGVTNVIALDADRNIIQDQRILVSRDDARSINLVKGGKRYSYNCSPSCNPSLVIGDDNNYFQGTWYSSVIKKAFSEGADDKVDFKNQQNNQNNNNPGSNN